MTTERLPTAPARTGIIDAGTLDDCFVMPSARVRQDVAT